MPGERVQLFGRNLARGSPDVLPRLYLKSAETGRLYRGVWGKSRAQGPLMFEGDHRVEFVLPEDIEPGPYDAWYHNGSGGKYGWSRPLGLEILESRDLIQHAAAAWNRSGVQADSETLSDLDVERIPQALCDGITDATEKLQQAIDAAAEGGGGIVLLPPGTCGVTNTIHLQPGVILRGAGRGATTLTVAFGKRLVRTDRESGDALVRIRTEAGISDMELRGGPGVDKLVLVRNYPEVASHVFFNRVDFDYAGRAAVLEDGQYRGQTHGVDVHGPVRHFTMWRCKVAAPGPLSIYGGRQKARYCRIIGNHFEVTGRHRTGCVGMKSVYDSMIEGNTFAGGNRAMLMGYGSSRNWVFENRVTGTTRSPNGHEVFMSEFGGTARMGEQVWFGTPVTVEARRTSFTQDLEKDLKLAYGATAAEVNDVPYESYLYVAEGRGLGQYRRIEAIEARSVVTERPWNVVPDSTTRLVVFFGPVRNMWVDNVTGPGDGISQFLWGGGIENIVDGHFMWGEGGLSIHSRAHCVDSRGQVEAYGVLAFNQVLNCRVKGGGTHGASFKVWSGCGRKQPVAEGTPYSVLGNTLRGNMAAGYGENTIKINGPARVLFDKRWVDDVSAGTAEQSAAFELVGGFNLLEHNFSVGLPVGIKVRGDGEGNFLSHNRLDRCRIPVLDATGRALVVPPSEIQEYEATVPNASEEE
jgi:hypothetical protein